MQALLIILLWSIVLGGWIVLYWRWRSEVVEQRLRDSVEEARRLSEPAPSGSIMHEIQRLRADWEEEPPPCER